MRPALDKIGTTARLERGVTLVADEFRSPHGPLELGQRLPDDYRYAPALLRACNRGRAAEPSRIISSYRRTQGAYFQAGFDAAHQESGGAMRPWLVPLVTAAEISGGVAVANGNLLGAEFGSQTFAGFPSNLYGCGGAYAYVYHDSPGTITTSTVLGVDPAGWGSGAITTMEGLRVYDPGASWNGSSITIGSYYAIRADVSPDVATPGTRFGVYLGGGAADLALEECTTAPTGVANLGRVFTEDNGSGKTRLMVQFGTGAAQQLAIEP